MSDLLAYEMPITKIIEDNSLKDLQDMKKQKKYNIPMFRVKQEKFAMRNHIDSGRKVSINREKLIAKLKDNRTQHDHIYNEAREGFQTELRETMQNVGAWLVETVEQGLVKDLEVITDRVSALSEIEVPQNYLEAYDEAIELFEWDESPVIVLTWSEFRKFVLDKWDWQDHFLASNAKHSGTARALRSRN